MEAGASAPGRERAGPEQSKMPPRPKEIRACMNRRAKACAQVLNDGVFQAAGTESRTHPPRVDGQKIEIFF